MSSVSSTQLLELWQQEQISAEMAIGYLIQNQAKQETAIVSVNVSWAKLRSDVDRLTAHTGLEPESTKSRPADKG